MTESTIKATDSHSPAPASAGLTAALLLDLTEHEQQAEALRRIFRRAAPGAHRVIEELLPIELANTLSAGLSAANAAARSNGRLGYREFPPRVRELVWELSNGSFMRYLRILSGVGNLVPDPLLQAGGVQRLGAGEAVPMAAEGGAGGTGLERALSLVMWLQAGPAQPLSVTLRGSEKETRAELEPGGALIGDSRLLATDRPAAANTSSSPGWLLQLHYYVNPESMQSGVALFPAAAGDSTP